MSSDGAALAAMIILIFPMGFFLMSSPAFLLVKLDIPEVTQLLRGVISAYFLMVAIAAAIGVALFAATGRIGFAAEFAMLAAFATMARSWFLNRWDNQLKARDGGDCAAVPRLRRLHWQAMLSNVIQLGVVLSSLSFVAVP